MREFVVEKAAAMLGCLVPFSWLALGIGLLVLVPMAFFKSTRGPAGLGLFIASYVFGITTWLLGTVVTFSVYGWLALIVGLLLMGFGVVPIALFAAIFSLKSMPLASVLILGSAAAIGARIGGAALMSDSSE